MRDGHRVGMDARVRARTVAAGVIRGAAAGAAGTTALNAVTYLDMALRGRPASSVPEAAIERASRTAHLSIPGSGESRSNRLSGLAALGGIATGVGVGAVVGLIRALGWDASAPTTAIAAGAGAMAVADVPLAASGLSEPQDWSAADWLSDLAPHAAYGLVTAAVVRGLLPPAQWRVYRRAYRALRRAMLRPNGGPDGERQVPLPVR
jgi:hypothetical protein